MKISRFRLVFCLFAAMALSGGALWAQAATITTADTFFSEISDNYASISDYTANIAITVGSGAKSEVMKGQVAFKKPVITSYSIHYTKLYEAQSGHSRRKSARARVWPGRRS